MFVFVFVCVCVCVCVCVERAVFDVSGPLSIPAKKCYVLIKVKKNNKQLQVLYDCFFFTRIITIIVHLAVEF